MERLNTSATRVRRVDISLIIKVGLVLKETNKVKVNKTSRPE